MITENDFFYVLKDIAVSLREIAYALKNNNNANEGTAQHCVKDSITALDAAIKEGVAKEDAEENADIKRIMNEKPSESELYGYGRVTKPKGKKQFAKPYKAKKPFVKKSSKKMTTTSPSVSSGNDYLDVFSGNCKLINSAETPSTNQNPDSDFV